jgi:glycosyltransferase involved in cell wall biosynthesis
VLFLAYYFPPLGGGGVQRSLKFCKYLPQHGYAPIVVTGPPRQSFSWTPEDDRLLLGLPSDIEVARVEGEAPPRSTGWPARKERWLRVQDPFSRWWVKGAIEVGNKIGANADVIYASMSPFETAFAAAELARRLRRPWIADLRDPWALDEWLVYPTGVHRRLELRTMRRALASASAIVMNTPEATRQLLRAFPEFRSRPVFTITNGFDAEDFDGPTRPRSDSSFRIVHAGYLHTATGRKHRRERIVRQVLGGSVRGLEILPRSHVFLVDAVESLVRGRPDLAVTIELQLAGLFSESDRSSSEGAVVRPLGYLPHDETVALLRSADLLFLPMHDLPEGTRSTIVPGKTYEYLASGTPILAAIPDGDARDFLAAAGNAALCRPMDVACMAAAIGERVDAKKHGTPPAEPDPAIVARFERRKLTSELAKAFDTVLSSAEQTRPSGG